MEGCKWRFAKVDGINKDIVDAVSGERGICPLCGADMVAKVGEVRVPHWSHVGKRVCDDWYQPKGPWHLYWQNKFPKDWQEVVVLRGCEKHIADIKTSYDAVVEVQWSPITPEEINERENFYKNMLWIVGMNRIDSDRRVKLCINEGISPLDIEGFRIRKIYYASRLNEAQYKWFECSRPVFLDFGTEPDRLDATDDLYFIVPGDKWRRRYCIDVPRDCLIAALNQGRSTIREFFLKLKQVREIYEQKERERSEAARIRSEQERQKILDDIESWQVVHRNEEYEKARPYLNYANSVEHAVAFANQKFHYPPRCALTLGWVEAFLILFGYVKSIRINTVKISIAPYGRVAIHLSNKYSREVYNQDCLKARERGIDCEIETYEVLERFYKDKIVGCSDYLAKHAEKGLLLTFAQASWFLDRTNNAYTRNRSERTFWNLPENTQNYLANVDPESKMRKFFW